MTFETLALDLPGGAFHALAARSSPAPIGYHRAMVRPLRTFAARRRALAVTIAAPLLQLHGQQGGCIAPAPEGLDRPWFAARDHRVVPNAGHSVFQEAPHEMAARAAAWLA